MPQEIHYERDKRLIPYLLALQPKVNYVGTKVDNGVVYFGFTPLDKALDLVSLFFTDNAPTIPAKKLFEAMEEFRTILYREKDRQRMGYGGNYEKHNR